MENGMDHFNQSEREGEEPAAGQQAPFGKTGFLLSLAVWVFVAYTLVFQPG